MKIEVLYRKKQKSMRKSMLKSMQKSMWKSRRKNICTKNVTRMAHVKKGLKIKSAKIADAGEGGGEKKKKKKKAKNSK